MKNVILTSMIVLLAFAGITVKAQTLEEDLKKVYQQLDSVKSSNDLMAVSATFDVLASTYPDAYITNYYAAYTKAIASYGFEEKEMSKKDQILDMADLNFEKVKQLGPQDDETFVLGALLANARLAVDGQNRWQQYGPIFDKNLEDAKAIDANNPRIYYLKGVSLFYTPKMFGGGAKKAMEYFERAKPLFEAEDQSDLLKPTWGKTENAEYMRQCEEGKEGK